MHALKVGFFKDACIDSNKLLCRIHKKYSVAAVATQVGRSHAEPSQSILESSLTLSRSLIGS